MLGWVGEFEAEVSSISSEIHKFYLLNMEVFKSKEFTIAREWPTTCRFSSLVYKKKVTVANFAFYENIDLQIRPLSVAIEHNFNPEYDNLN